VNDDANTHPSVSLQPPQPAQLGGEGESHVSPRLLLNRDECAPDRRTQVRAGPRALSVPRIAREPLLKRPLDVWLSGAMLLASAPIWLGVALAIKLEDGGPVLYRQRRWGRGGKPFDVCKFRSMVVNADRLRQATKDDDRVTRVGRLMRVCGMDELPQLLAIFRGEMSFVGPRALAVGEVDAHAQPMQYEDVPGFLTRLSVRPGLTGLATIYLPKDASPRRKFAVDALYVRRLSLGLDVRLILLSFWISFRGKWETRGRKIALRRGLKWTALRPNL